MVDFYEINGGNGSQLWLLAAATLLQELLWAIFIQDKYFNILYIVINIRPVKKKKKKSMNEEWWSPSISLNS